MPPIDILNIQPTTVNASLANKFILIYGESKCGKTSFATQIPKSLLLAFEVGYHSLPGVIAQDISCWGDFKTVLKQLESPAAREKFDSVIIDTATIAYDYCEQFVCQQNGVSKIGDIPYGSGYAATKKEFAESFRRLSQMGYGIVFIAHADKTVVTDEKGAEIKVLAPDLQKRAAAVIEPLVDLIGMIESIVKEGGSREAWLYTRKTPTVMAGSRWRYLAPKIPFGYTELINAITTALEKEQAEGNTVSYDAIPERTVEYDYNAIRAEAEELWKTLVGKDKANANKILSIAENIFGHPVRLSEITEKQVEPYALLVEEMKKL